MRRCLLVDHGIFAQQQHLHLWKGRQGENICYLARNSRCDVALQRQVRASAGEIQRDQGAAAVMRPETPRAAGVTVRPGRLHYAWVVAGVTFAAALMERFGLRRTMLGGLTAIGVGVLATPTMHQPWQLILLWGVVVGAGSGMVANVLAATVAVRWFAARRGLVVGLLTAAAAGGQLVFLPVFAAIAVAYGWRWMALTLAAVALGLIPLVATLMRNRPEDVGWSRSGEPAKPAGQQPPPAAGNPITAAFGALALGLRSRNFWLIGGA